LHPIALILVFLLVADLVLGVASDVLNLRQTKRTLPSQFRGWYDPQRYAKSQHYLGVTTRFGWFVSVTNLLLLLGFWFGGGFGWLDGRVRTLEVHEIAAGLIYIGALLLLKTLLNLPASIYATFVIESRFGFNKTTWKLFVKDRIKGLLLGLLLGAPLAAAVLSFFQYAGAHAWWYCWLATTGFMLLMQYIAPTYIMPLFNRFEPLPSGCLRDAITAYARSIDFDLDNIFVMDGSRRSTKSNAFFTGFGRHRRIVLFDTLIEKHTVDELVAVLAHEMGHYKLRHILKGTAIGIVQSGTMFYLLSLFISHPGLFEAFYVPDVSVYAGLIFFGMLYAPIDGVLALATHAFSRRNEYAADRFSIRTSGKGEAMVTALKRLSVDNLSNLQPHPLHVFLNYSHPPVLARIDAIERWLNRERAE
jgi:STE24 endopeptidase